MMMIGLIIIHVLCSFSLIPIYIFSIFLSFFSSHAKWNWKEATSFRYRCIVRQCFSLLVFSLKTQWKYVEEESASMMYVYSLSSGFISLLTQLWIYCFLDALLYAQWIPNIIIIIQHSAFIQHQLSLPIKALVRRHFYICFLIQSHFHEGSSLTTITVEVCTHL